MTIIVPSPAHLGWVLHLPNALRDCLIPLIYKRIPPQLATQSRWLVLRNTLLPEDAEAPPADERQLDTISAGQAAGPEGVRRFERFGAVQGRWIRNSEQAQNLKAFPSPLKNISAKSDLFDPLSPFREGFLLYMTGGKVSTLACAGTTRYSSAHCHAPAQGRKAARRIATTVWRKKQPDSPTTASVGACYVL